jgi:hypothetical protein
MRQYERLGEQARTATVDPSDGISEVEAYKIGLDRFRTYHTACGATSLPVDLGNYWRVTTSAGDAGIPVEDILIRKSDGFTTITTAKLSDPPNKSADSTTSAVASAAEQPRVPASAASHL